MDPLETTQGSTIAHIPPANNEAAEAYAPIAAGVPVGGVKRAAAPPVGTAEKSRKRLCRYPGCTKVSLLLPHILSRIHHVWLM